MCDSREIYTILSYLVYIIVELVEEFVLFSVLVQTLPRDIHVTGAASQ